MTHGLSCATAYFPNGRSQSRPFPAPGPFAHIEKFTATPPIMNFGVGVAKRVSRHQPNPPSMSEYRSLGASPSNCANIHVPKSPVWNREPGYSSKSGHAAAYSENPALNSRGDPLTGTNMYPDISP